MIWYDMICSYTQLLQWEYFMFTKKNIVVLEGSSHVTWHNIVIIEPFPGRMAKELHPSLRAYAGKITKNHRIFERGTWCLLHIHVFPILRVIASKWNDTYLYNFVFLSFAPKSYHDASDTKKSLARVIDGQVRHANPVHYACKQILFKKEKKGSSCLISKPWEIHLENPHQRNQQIKP